MIKRLAAVGAILGGCATAFGQTAVVTHAELQAVNSTGHTA